jgi:hypothetical protein
VIRLLHQSEGFRPGNRASLTYISFSIISTFLLADLYIDFVIKSLIFRLESEAQIISFVLFDSIHLHRVDFVIFIHQLFFLLEYIFLQFPHFFGQFLLKISFILELLD